MRQEILTQLRRVVLAAPDHLLRMEAVTKPVGCGTARCAIGWMIVDPWFRENTLIGRFFPVDYDQGDTGGLTVSQLADMLGLGVQDALHLLYPPLSSCSKSLVSKEEVVWNIDELLAGRSALSYRCGCRISGGPFAGRAVLPEPEPPSYERWEF